MGCAPSSPTRESTQLQGLLAVLHIGGRVEVADSRWINLHAFRQMNAERCGQGWAPNAPTSELKFAPAPPGYWWPATVIALSSAKGVKVAFEGYNSTWHTWINNPDKVPQHHVTECVTAIPAAGTTVEVQLVQLAPFWARGRIVGRDGTTRDRAIVGLMGDSSTSLNQLSTVCVPLRFLRVVDGTGDVLERFANVSSTSPVPSAIVVRHAGTGFVNGLYVRDGYYCEAPLYKCGQIWLLRYRLPSGAHFWYLADKDRLDVDDGDYYRIRSEAKLPPTDAADTWIIAKDGTRPAPSFEQLFDEASPAVGVAVDAAVNAADLNGIAVTGTRVIAQGVSVDPRALPVVLGVAYTNDVSASGATAV